jgi:SAM-dependent methyltransferase
MSGLFGFWRRAPSLPDTALAMVGPRSRDEVLVVGTQDLSLAAEIGAITRLNGRTVVMGEGPAEAAATTRAAEKAGALLEFIEGPLVPLPFGDATFHIVLVPDLMDWPSDLYAPRLAEAIRVLEPGGRLVILTGKPRRSRLALAKDRPTVSSGVVLGLLSGTDLLAARKLAEADGVAYYEARKAR